MSLCTLNITIGIFRIGQQQFIEREFERVLIKFLTSKRTENRCKLIYVDGVGELLPNGSFTGAKKLLKDNLISFYCKWENLFFSENEGLDKFIDFSSPCLSETFHLGEYSDILKAQNVDSLAFLEHSKAIIKAIWIGFLMNAFLIFLFQWIKLKDTAQNSFKRIFLRSIYFFMNKTNALTKLNLIIIFFLMFTQILLNMLTSNIKTNEVLVETSEIIDSFEKLQNTNRYGCWFEDDSVYIFIKNSQKGTSLREILDQKKKSKDETCSVDDFYSDMNTIKKFEPTKSFFLMNRISVYYTLRLLNEFVKDKIIFEKSLLDYELTQVIYVSSVLEKLIKKQLLDRIRIMFENGLFFHVYEEFILGASNLVRNRKFYTRIEDLKNDFIKIENLDLNFFMKLFICLFVIYTILILLFVIHILLNFLKKHRKFLRLKLNEYKFDLKIRISFKYPVLRFR